MAALAESANTAAAQHVCFSFMAPMLSRNARQINWTIRRVYFFEIEAATAIFPDVKIVSMARNKSRDAGSHP
jgi:hypothetical protein